MALLVTVNIPLAAPATVGANCTSTLALWPIAKEEEGLPPMTVKTPPVIEAAEMLTAPVPVLVMTTLCVAVAPTATLPNKTVVTLGVRMPPPEFPTPPPLSLVEADV